MQAGTHFKAGYQGDHVHSKICALHMPELGPVAASFMA